MTVLLIALAWLVLSIGFALFFGRLCAMGTEWDETVRREVDAEDMRGRGAA